MNPASAKYPGKLTEMLGGTLNAMTAFPLYKRLSRSATAANGG
jgi:hypothetical protein